MHRFAYVYIVLHLFEYSCIVLHRFAFCCTDMNIHAHMSVEVLWQFTGKLPLLWWQFTGNLPYVCGNLPGICHDRMAIYR